MGSRRLRAAYEASPSTYQLLGAPCCRTCKTSASPTCWASAARQSSKKLNEAGEYTYGTISEDATGYRAFSYGRAIAMTRQMFVNDDLNAFDRLLHRFGESARRLENRLVYDQITGNPAMQDGKGPVPC